MGDALASSFRALHSWTPRHLLFPVFLPTTHPCPTTFPSPCLSPPESVSCVSLKETSSSPWTYSFPFIRLPMLPSSLHFSFCSLRLRQLIHWHISCLVLGFFSPLQFSVHPAIPSLLSTVISLTSLPYSPGPSPFPFFLCLSSTLCFSFFLQFRWLLSPPSPLTLGCFGLVFILSVLQPFHRLALSPFLLRSLASSLLCFWDETPPPPGLA